MAITLEAIRAAGGIVHSDGNIFFRDISMLQGLAGAAPAAVAPRGEYPHEQMDAMALDRYKVVPSNASMLWSHAVVAGDGTQQLYVGREVECQNMVRKFAGAFLDGAFAFHSTAAAPTAQAAPALEAPAAPEQLEAWWAAQLAAAPQAPAQEAPAVHTANGTPPLTPDEARWAAQSADRMRSPSDVTSGTEYAMAGAMALAKKLAAAPVDDLAQLVKQLVRALRKAAPGNDLADKALDYLRRQGLQGSPLRAAPAAPINSAPPGYRLQPISEYDAMCAAMAAPAAPSKAAIHDAAYCALQYVEHALAAIANREELSDGAIERVDTIGKASKRAKAALTRLQSVAQHFDAAAPAAPAVDASDTALLDAMERERIAVIPEFEGPWDAQIFGEDEAALACGSGATPREAITEALASLEARKAHDAAQAKEGGE